VAQQLAAQGGSQLGGATKREKDKARTDPHTHNTLSVHVHHITTLSRSWLDVEAGRLGNGAGAEEPPWEQGVVWWLEDVGILLS